VRVSPTLSGWPRRLESGANVVLGTSVRMSLVWGAEFGLSPLSHLGGSRGAIRRPIRTMAASRVGGEVRGSPYWWVEIANSVPSGPRGVATPHPPLQVPRVATCIMPKPRALAQGRLRP
jgi:hypothetical protein